MQASSFYTTGFSKLRESLIARYNEPHRFYHNIFHINDMLNLAAGIMHYSPNSSVTNLSIWYHDAIYDPTKTDNEEKSAELAIEELKDKITSEELDEVVAGILLTKHQFSSTLLAKHMSIIIDADLYILSHDWCYTAYAKAIRKEYAHVTDAQYIEGRKTFLTKMLKRNQYYNFFQDRAPKARQNMNMELEYLNKDILL